MRALNRNCLCRNDFNPPRTKKGSNSGQLLVPRLFAFAHIRTLGKRNMRPNGRLLHLTTCLDATERSRDAMNESLLENVMPDTTKVREHYGAMELTDRIKWALATLGWPFLTSSSRSRSSLPRWRRPGSARFV